jgi:hypothetical protein
MAGTLRDLWIRESASAFNPLNQYSRLYTVALAWDETRPRLLSYSIDEPAPFQPRLGGHKSVARIKDDEMFVIFADGKMVDLNKDVWMQLEKTITAAIQGRRGKNKAVEPKNYLSHAHRLISEFRKILAHRAPGTDHEAGPTPLSDTEKRNLAAAMQVAQAEEQRIRAEAEKKAAEEAQKLAEEEARKAAEKPAKRKISEMSAQEIQEARQRLSARLDELGKVKLRGMSKEDIEAHRASIFKIRENIGKLTRGLRERGPVTAGNPERRFSKKMGPGRGGPRHQPRKPHDHSKK